MVSVFLGRLFVSTVLGTVFIFSCLLACPVSSEVSRFRFGDHGNHAKRLMRKLVGGLASLPLICMNERFVLPVV